MSATTVTQWKALVAGAVAAVATGVTAYFAGTDKFTVEGGLAAAGAALAAYVTTYVTPRHGSHTT